MASSPASEVEAAAAVSAPDCSRKMALMAAKRNPRYLMTLPTEGQEEYEPRVRPSADRPSMCSGLRVPEAEPIDIRIGRRCAA